MPVHDVKEKDGKLVVGAYAVIPRLAPHKMWTFAVLIALRNFKLNLPLSLTLTLSVWPSCTQATLILWHVACQAAPCAHTRLHITAYMVCVRTWVTHRLLSACCVRQATSC